MKVSRIRSAIAGAALFYLSVAHGQAAAQVTRLGTLLVTITDPTGAVLPGANVIVTLLTSDPNGATSAAARANEKGVATIAPLVPGRYLVQADFPGLEIGVVRDVRVESGENRRVIALALKRVEDSVTVGIDRQVAAADRGAAFGTELTREQIQGLSNDRSVMQQQLLDMAGPDAIIRVDSFEGGQLPSRAQIKSIHITRDQFAAESHSAGGTFVDIITQPGLGPVRGSTDLSYRDGSMTSRSPFVPVKGPEQTQDYAFQIGGSIVENTSSFFLSARGGRSYDTPNVRAALPSGTQSEALNLRQLTDYSGGFGHLDWAFTKNQVLRLTYSQDTTDNRNLGVGAYDLLERAYRVQSNNYVVRAQEAGPLGRRMFMNTRLQVTASDSQVSSTVEAPTVVVLDSFTSGGAQQKGARRTLGFDFASDVDYIIGRNSWRFGVALVGGRERTDEASNYLGTFTFESLEAYQANRPRSYTRRIGDPNIRYTALQAGLYAQDDIRIRKGLTLSVGARYEAQRHILDFRNVDPRVGLTWAPFKSGRTTVRTSAGIFNDWIGQGTYEQTLRVDGFRQQELNIVNPSYPDPGLNGAIPPINRYLLSNDIRLLRYVRISAGIDQRFTPRIRAGVTYSHTTGSHLTRGLNLNAPAAGVRPDPQFANVIEAESDAGSRQDAFNANFSFNFNPKSSDRFLDPRRLTLSGSVGLLWARNNSDGAFSVPPSGTIATEWGPSGGDIRRRGNIGINTQVVRGLNTYISVSMSSAPPYTLRTGVDDNGDLILNDRPAGVGRNTLRARGQITLNANFSYAVMLGDATRNEGRYTLSFWASITNLANHYNYVGFSGVMTSPFFGKPTAISGPRRLNMGLTMSF